MFYRYKDGIRSSGGPLRNYPVAIRPDDRKTCGKCGETKCKARFLPRTHGLGRVVICKVCVEKLRTEANGKCCLCDRVGRRLCIDHDHTTGKVRGLICSQCNNAIGTFRDSVALFERAIRYLKGEPLDDPQGENSHRTDSEAPCGGN